jgi:hypothetical protein
MVKKLIRPGLILSLVGLAILIAGMSLKTDVTAARGDKHINIESFSWGITQPQLLRVCLGNRGSDSSAGPRESVTFTFIKIQTTFDEVILERSLSVPQGHFRCTDFSHSELVAAGLVPEPTTRVDFLVTVGLTEASTVGAAQEVTVGAAQTITIASGKTETYKTIQTRQTTVVQDL